MRKIAQKIYNNAWSKIKKDLTILEDYSIREIIFSVSDSFKLDLEETDEIENKLNFEFKL